MGGRAESVGRVAGRARPGPYVLRTRRAHRTHGRLLTRAGEWAFRLGRVGYVAKGVVYGLTGMLAIMAAAGERAPLTDPPGALRLLAKHPLGRMALVVLGVGLLVYMGVMLLKSIADPERRGLGPVSLIVRTGEILTAVGHGLLGVGALQLVSHGPGPGNADQSAREMARTVLALPLGDVLTMAIGLAIFVVGTVLMVNGLLAPTVCRELRLDGFGRLELVLVAGIRRAGMIGQGTLLGLVGGSIARAAWRGHPGLAHGPAGALRFLAGHGHGGFIVGALAAGLLAVGAASFIDARCRVFAPPPPEPPV